ncbi:hypothetical protein [Nocardiopsis alba]|uniref:hypothetical protein n=1 Tax=Nocardiopsis alba TaxID=53437 RepID=UPI001F2CAB7C|nr:hypothetical protein [Nocardiopsis alba]
MSRTSTGRSAGEPDASATGRTSITVAAVRGRATPSFSVIDALLSFTKAAP